MKYKTNIFMSRFWVIVGFLLISCICICAIIFFSPYPEVSLFDFPGTKTDSLRFMRAQRILNLAAVDETMVERDLFEKCYPEGEFFYISNSLPISIVEKNGVVDVVRVGSAFGVLREIKSYGYVMSPDLLRYIATELEKVDVRLPYELIVATTAESATSAFWRPYLVGPNRLAEGDLVCLDFINVEAPDYWPVKLFFLKDKLVAFEVKRSFLRK